MNTTRVANPVNHRVSGLGTSLHGGRPTFVLRKVDESYIMYELLPNEQAKAHKERWKDNRQVNRNIKLVEPTFLESKFEWCDWKGVKIAKIDKIRFDALRSLMKNVFENTDLKYVDVLQPGDWALLLPEASGVKLSIAFVAVKPLKRIDKHRACARHIERMSTEECYYWHSLCRSPSTPNGGKALRKLLTGHMR